MSRPTRIPSLHLDCAVSFEGRLHVLRDVNRNGNLDLSDRLGDMSLRQTLGSSYASYASPRERLEALLQVTQLRPSRALIDYVNRLDHRWHGDDISESLDCLDLSTFRKAP